MSFCKVIVDRIGIDVVTHDPVIILSDVEKHKVLPLVIGIFEATSIAFAMESHTLPRPLSHDIIKDLIEQLNAKLLRIEIYGVERETYLSNLILENKDGNIIKVDSRPSDAIAVALRMGVDIYISEELLDRSGMSASLSPGSIVNGGKEKRVGFEPNIIVSVADGTEENIAPQKRSVDAKLEQEVDDFLNGLSLDGLDSDDDEK